MRNDEKAILGPAWLAEPAFRASVEEPDTSRPVRQSSLLFAGMAYTEPKYLALWGRLDPDPTNEGVNRNYPIRQPLLWVR